jgi:hypothetical protein
MHVGMKLEQSIPKIIHMCHTCRQYVHMYLISLLLKKVSNFLHRKGQNTVKLGNPG